MAFFRDASINQKPILHIHLGDTGRGCCCRGRRGATVVLSRQHLRCTVITPHPPQGFEERVYPAQKWVSTTMEGTAWYPIKDTMFVKLLSYISGYNDQSKSGLRRITKLPQWAQGPYLVGVKEGFHATSVDTKISVSCF